MSVRQAGGLLTMVIILLGFTVLAAAVSGNGRFVLPIVLGIGVVSIVRHFVTVCPGCGKSAFVSYLLGEQTWFRRNILYMIRPWPETKCSRCGLDLSAT